MTNIFLSLNLQIGYTNKIKNKIKYQLYHLKKIIISKYYIEPELLHFKNPPDSRHTIYKLKQINKLWETYCYIDILSKIITHLN